MEKDLFLTLLSVNGIGPKGALSILSGSEPSQLVQAIINGDKELLTKIPGIGKKTAERVLLELAEPLRKKMDQAQMGFPAGPTGATSKDASSPSGSKSQTLRDTLSALVGLGYRENEVMPVISRALAESQSAKTEDLIKLALRQLS
jgi:Holliday junction DNA helicase RuvA